MARIYEVFNHTDNSRQFYSEDMLEQYYPELKAGTLEIVDEYDSEEFEHPNLPSLEEIEYAIKTLKGE